MVLSTDWRRTPQLKIRLTSVLFEYGVKVIGATMQGPMLRPVRPREIVSWLEGYEVERRAHKGMHAPVSRWVAVDDRDLLREESGGKLTGHFVHTVFGEGLTETHADRMITILNQDLDPPLPPPPQQEEQQLPSMPPNPRPNPAALARESHDEEPPTSTTLPPAPTPPAPPPPPAAPPTAARASASAGGMRSMSTAFIPPPTQHPPLSPVAAPTGKGAFAGTGARAASRREHARARDSAAREAFARGGMRGVDDVARAGPPAALAPAASREPATPGLHGLPRSMSTVTLPPPGAPALTASRSWANYPSRESAAGGGHSNGHVSNGLSNGHGNGHVSNGLSNGLGNGLSWMDHAIAGASCPPGQSTSLQPSATVPQLVPPSANADAPTTQGQPLTSLPPNRFTNIAHPTDPRGMLLAGSPAPGASYPRSRATPPSFMRSHRAHSRQKEPAERDRRPSAGPLGPTVTSVTRAQSVPKSRMATVQLAFEVGGGGLAGESS